MHLYVKRASGILMERMNPPVRGKTLLLLKPRGFCAGVVRAIDIVRIALETFGPPSTSEKRSSITGTWWRS